MARERTTVLPSSCTTTVALAIVDREVDWTWDDHAQALVPTERNEIEILDIIKDGNKYPYITS